MCHCQQRLLERHRLALATKHARISAPLQEILTFRAPVRTATQDPAILKLGRLAAAPQAIRNLLVEAPSLVKAPSLVPTPAKNLRLLTAAQLQTAVSLIRAKRTTSKVASPWNPSVKVVGLLLRCAQVIRLSPPLKQDPLKQDPLLEETPIHHRLAIQTRDVCSSVHQTREQIATQRCLAAQTQTHVILCVQGVCPF